jgi:hypothetical protein
MKFEKPRIRRTYVQAIDRDTKSTKSITVYDATPEEVIEHLKRSVKEPRRTAQPTTVAG